MSTSKELADLTSESTKLLKRRFGSGLAAAVGVLGLAVSYLLPLVSESGDSAFLYNCTRGVSTFLVASCGPAFLYFNHRFNSIVPKAEESINNLLRNKAKDVSRPQHAPPSEGSKWN